MISFVEEVFNVLANGKFFLGEDISNLIHTFQSLEEIASAEQNLVDTL